MRRDEANPDEARHQRLNRFFARPRWQKPIIIVLDFLLPWRRTILEDMLDEAIETAQLIRGDRDRMRNARTRARVARSNDLAAEAVRLRQAGMRIEDIAERLDRTPRWVTKQMPPSLKGRRKFRVK